MAFAAVYSVAILVLSSFTSLSSSQTTALRGRAYVFFAQRNISAPFLVAGVLDFEQNIFDLRINGSVSGLTAGSHGFHVHERGDIGNGCSAAAAHYNPLGRVHGGPGEQFPTVRHVGDLGNIVASANQVAVINQIYRGLGLSGPFSILGRTIVIHERADDLGRGSSPASKTTGDAGGRVACGIIGRVVRPRTYF